MIAVLPNADKRLNISTMPVMGRIEYVVRIEKQNIARLEPLKRQVVGRDLPAVVLENSRYARGVGLHDGARSIRRSVVDDDDVCIHVVLRERGIYCLCQILFIVVVADHNVHFFHGDFPARAQGDLTDRIRSNESAPDERSCNVHGGEQRDDAPSRNQATKRGSLEVRAKGNG